MSTSQQVVITKAASRVLPTQLKFSLVLATIGRTLELSNFLEHLDRQLYRNFELIVVDQNLDDALVPILAPYTDRFAIKHVKSTKGLSRARNLGLRYVSGDIVGFPDDDCWYEATSLQQIVTMLINHPDWDGVAGGIHSPWGKRFLDRESGFLNKYNVWRRAISYTIFLRTAVIQSVGEFDPMLGVGSDSGYGSGEEMDYLLRATEVNRRIYYDPKPIVDHPDSSPVFDNQRIGKGYSYARGVGYTLRKHHYPLWYLGYVLLRSSAGIALSGAYFNWPKASYHWALAKGRLSGWMGRGSVVVTDVTEKSTS